MKARPFQPVTARSIGELNRTEAKALRDWKKWLDEVRLVAEKHIRWSLPLETFQIPKGLESILQELGRTSLSLGRRQGKRETNALKRHYRKASKLAMAPPSFTNFKVTPVEAIEAMDVRENYIAGQVQDDLFDEIRQVIKDNLDDKLSRAQAERMLQGILDDSLGRASLIVTTETTYGVNRGRLTAFAEDGVDYVEFLGVRDDRQSEICRSRHGKIMRLDDPRLAENTPPLHGRCRSLLSPIYSAFEPDLIKDANRNNWDGVHPLPNGWRK
ncbi:minor capsid protein [Paenibacillus naphthalenovorans]|uniref:minor capsid protein n=1 Tax=Paenibacillus naphthalenovorans TaxID=162209 RepID=UPI003D28A3B6